MKAAIRAQQDQQIENVSSASYFHVLLPSRFLINQTGLSEAILE